ncbi:hypothetical protein Tcan_04136 [Toxocara canis]|uniref:Uncharacterized protein n=1 Tax=Toxocara canis TaxID=6265 RepID=A0A0B2VW70_TOXCA|nr:hypothetical protein Tcan_04136 [Toxocara canis]
MLMLLILRVVYVVCVTAMVVLTAVSVVSPGWRSFHKNDGLPDSTGLFPKSCVPSKDNSVAKVDLDYCEKLLKNKSLWEIIVAICLISGLIIELLALLLGILTFSTCCDTRSVNTALPICGFLATLLVISAVTIYAVKNKDLLADDSRNVYEKESITSIENAIKDSSLGYCFYLAIFAAVVGLFVTTFGSIIAVCFGRE